MENALETLYNAAVQNSADVSTTIQSCYAVDSEFSSLKNLQVNIMKPPVPLAPVSADLKTRIFQELFKTGVQIATWYFLYRRKFLLENDIKFPDEVAEDVFFSFDVICATSKIVKIEKPLYVYRTRQNSASHDSKRLQKNIKAIPLLSDHIKEKLKPLRDENFTRIIVAYWVNHVMNGYVLPFLKGDSKSAAVEEIAKFFDSKFEKNSAFVSALFQFYLQGRDAMRENQILKNKLGSIKEILKS